ncbi:MAG: ThiF family adenylyltransferase [Rhizomicrobium sp.]|nr:ThiF family adenylyltransferase [Rhizomicrobium sp.]
MIWWYLRDLRRHKEERVALNELVQRVDWLQPVGWQIDDQARLVFESDIRVAERVYHTRLLYPETFPHSPPYVLPRDGAERWSGHQYGAGGELCLQYRADNWTPDIMGFQMIESAYRLLAGENPAASQRGVVPSAHRLSAGQELRSEFRRFVLTRNVRAMLDAMTAGEHRLGTGIVHFREHGFVYRISTMNDAEGVQWTDRSAPSSLMFEGSEASASIVRIAPSATFPPPASLAEFDSAAAKLGCDVSADIVVILREQQMRVYRRLSSTSSVQSLPVVEPQHLENRLGAGYELLRSKRVGIVGCGSLGSKIATMLARAMVGKFLLVDDDLLLPDNLVRNDLDWRDVGLNKADALALRLGYANVETEVRKYRQQLGGQEAASSVEVVLSDLASCDLVIDTTANPVALNFISGVVVEAGKPVIWAEVFAGGFAGLIARARPSIEPPIQYMRRAIENWFADKQWPPVRAAAQYDRDTEGPPMVADDADVTSIAAPAARLAIDCLLGRTPSYFPHSVYVIGLSPGPGIEEPFETYPIELDQPSANPMKPPLAEAERDEEFEFLGKLFREKQSDESSST